VKKGGKKLIMEVKKDGTKNGRKERRKERRLGCMNVHG